MNDKTQIFSQLELLPPKFDATSKDILLALNKASRALSGLKIGKHSYYINTKLFEMLSNVI